MKKSLFSMTIIFVLIFTMAFPSNVFTQSEDPTADILSSEEVFITEDSESEQPDQSELSAPPAAEEPQPDQLESSAPSAAEDSQPELSDNPSAEDPQPELPETPSAEDPQPELSDTPSAEDPQPELSETPSAEDPQPESSETPSAEDPQPESSETPSAEDPQPESSETPAAEGLQPDQLELSDTPAAEDPQPESSETPSAEDPQHESSETPAAEGLQPELSDILENQEISTEEENSEEEDLSELVKAVNEAGLVIMDAQGEPVPLACNAAVDALSAPDPYVCSAPSTDPAHDSNCTGYVGLQKAINAANKGDYIYAAPGTYTEWNSKEKASIIINKPLSLFGMDKEATIIQGPNSSTDSNMAGAILMLIQASDVTVSGFTFSGAAATKENPYGSTMYGIVVQPQTVDGKITPLSNINISDNIFSFISESGVKFENVTKSIIENNEFRSETQEVWYEPLEDKGFLDKVTIGGSGPKIISSENITVESNVIVGVKGVGISVEGGKDNKIIKNKVLGDKESISDAGIRIQDSANITIRENDIWDFKGGQDPDYPHGKIGAGIDINGELTVAKFIEKNHLYNNSIGILVRIAGGTDSKSPFVDLKENQFIKNDNGLVNVKHPPLYKEWSWWGYDGKPLFREIDMGVFAAGDKIDANYNYWGCDGGPNSFGCDTIVGGPDTKLWLIDPDRDLIFEANVENLHFIDNCPNIYNPDQSDRDKDGIGDLCDPTPDGTVENPPTEEPTATPIPPIIVPTVTPEPVIATVTENDESILPIIIPTVIPTPVIIMATVNEPIPLSDEAATTLILPSQHKVTFNQPMGGYQAILMEPTLESLPAPLPEGNLQMVAALTVNLIKENTAVKVLENGTLQISFVAPEDGDFAVFYWDENSGKWIEITSWVLIDGRIVFTTNIVGTFVLAKK